MLILVVCENFKISLFERDQLAQHKRPDKLSRNALSMHYGEVEVRFCAARCEAIHGLRPDYIATLGNIRYNVRTYLDAIPGHTSIHFETVKELI